MKFYNDENFEIITGKLICLVDERRWNLNLKSQINLKLFKRNAFR